MIKKPNDKPNTTNTSNTPKLTEVHRITLTAPTQIFSNTERTLTSQNYSLVVDFDRRVVQVNNPHGEVWVPFEAVGAITILKKGD